MEAEPRTRLRLLMVTQWFDPEPAFKGLRFAKALQARGFDVRVVTGFPNYPGGKLYPGYQLRPWRHDNMDGVPVTRLALYPSHDRSALRRALNYVSFAASVSVHLLFFAPRADVVYVYHPPLTVGLAAAVARMFRRMPTVIDIQDLWPDTLRATGMITNARVLAWIGSACAWMYRNMDHVVVLSPGFKRMLRARGVPDGQLTVIYNWADESILAEPAVRTPPAAMEPSGRFRIMFAGNMGKAQGLDAVLEAAKTVAAIEPAIEFCFMGGGVEVSRLEARAKSELISNVRFLPQVPLSEAHKYLAAADALLVHLVRDPLFEITIPSKTQAYMVAGKPILMAVPGDARDLVERSGGGETAVSEDPQSIASAALRLYRAGDMERQRMADANRRYYLQHLSMDKGVSEFARVFHNTNRPS